MAFIYCKRYSVTVHVQCDTPYKYIVSERSNGRVHYLQLDIEALTLKNDECRNHVCSSL